MYIKILLTLCLSFSLTLFGQQPWEQLSSMPSARHHPISFSLDGKGYAVTGTNVSNQLTNTVFEYDPQTDSWKSLANFPGAARSFGIGVVANNKAYIGFGISSSQYLNDLWSYDPSDSSWTRLADCGCSGRRHPAMIAIGNRIYVGLGDDNISGNLRDWWMYDIPSDSWVQTANLPGPVRHHPYMFNAGGEVFAGLGHGGQNVYDDWYKLDTSSNTWTAMNDFPGEGRVAGTQFSFNGYGYVLSGDGDNHSYMENGEMWQYNPSNDSWKQLSSHPGRSRWAPGSFVIDSNVYFFAGLNRFTNTLQRDLWKFDLTDTTTSLSENKIALENTYVYPNPSSNSVYWENDRMITHVTLYNNIGQLLRRSDVREKQFDISSLSNGLYFVQFYAENDLVKTSKLIIKNSK